ncbi:MAG: hypothetical protein UZ12_BCD005002778 [Bacteroidetes bacterium OLB12]|nr:MAG: hypothetical protein UZ12_BCD005002778 [Bacteroidetes bacterium OLB12]
MVKAPIGKREVISKVEGSMSGLLPEYFSVSQGQDFGISLRYETTLRQPPFIFILYQIISILQHAFGFRYW